MPDALPLTGLFGKVPAHGDFVRRGLPTSFVAPWDAWLQDGMATARERLGDRWSAVWDGAPPWRFALPAGVCGPDAVAGVLLPSEDMVGRRFPITLAALLPGDATLPGPGWFAALEAAALAGRAGRLDADALAAAIPPTDAVIEIPPADGALPFAAMADCADAPAPFAPVVEPADGVVPDVVGAVASEPPAPREAEDVLDLFIGGSQMAPPSGPSGWEPSGVLAMLSGTAPDQPAMVSPTPIDASPEIAAPDVLAMLGGAGSEPPAWTAAPPEARVFDVLNAPDATPSASQDGTLAFLLGEGGGSDPAVAATRAPSEEADPLAVLIAASDAPLAAAPLHLAGTAEDEPSLIPADAVLVPDPAPIMQPAAPPAPPPGGGWWTGGGGRLPPSARPWPALLPAADFASLLEADA